MSALYSLQAEDVSAVATVYIYPLAPPANPDGTVTRFDPIEQSMLCTQELEKRKRELLSFHSDVLLSAAAPFSLSQGQTTHTGYHIFFNDVDAYGGIPQNVGSDFYLFCFVTDQWTVAYRFTYPSKSRVSGYIATFMQDMNWPK